MNLLLSLFLILFKAVPDALADRNMKPLAGVLSFIYHAVITILIFGLLTSVIPPIAIDYSLYYLLGGFLLLRFAIFSPIYNIVRGNPLFFIGTTKLYDRFGRWFFARTRIPKEHFLVMLKFISLLIGITWLI